MPLDLLFLLGKWGAGKFLSNHFPARITRCVRIFHKLSAIGREAPVMFKRKSKALRADTAMTD